MVGGLLPTRVYSLMEGFVKQAAGRENYVNEDHKWSYFVLFWPYDLKGR